MLRQPAQLGRPELDRDLRLVEGLDDLLGDVLPPFAARVDERNPVAEPGAGPLGEMLEEDALADAIGPEGGHGTSRGEGLASDGDLRVAPDKVRKIGAGRVHRPRERLVLELARDAFERAGITGGEGDRQVDRLLPDVGADGDLAVRRRPDRCA